MLIRDAIFSAMLQLQAPGQSVYSTIPLDFCDDDCKKTSLCEDPGDWRCSAPRLDSSSMARGMVILLSSGATLDEARAYMEPRSYLRPESFAEGAARYLTIAEATAEVAHRMTFDTCAAACSGDAVCLESCARYAPWRRTERELAFLLLTVTYKESGWRRDVHSGDGSMARGDCRYVTNDGKSVSAGTKGSRRVEGSCRSVCIAQIKTDAGEISPAGQSWHAEDLVGTDQTSTERCLTVAAIRLARSYSYCRSPVMPVYQDWADATLSAYGSGSSCQHPRLLGRSRTFWTSMRHPGTVPTELLYLLEQTEEEPLVEARVVIR